MMPRKEKKHRSRTLPPNVLSNLPESILDDILMRLPLCDAVRTSILSKKWRYNWCRLPQLTLDHTIWKAEDDRLYPTIVLRKIITNILTLHAGPIPKFTINIPYFKRCPRIDENLICFLSQNSIQHLVLRLPLLRGKPYKLPSSFFTCSQLRHLSLENCLVQPPAAFKGFDRLISLELRDVTISPKSLESLISHSPFLEQLVLLIPVSNDVIEINAPRLRSFFFRGSTRSLFFKHFPLITKLSIMDMDVSFLRRTGVYDIAKFCQSFSALEHLHLNDMWPSRFLGGIGGESSAREVPTKLPFVLHSIKHLCISGICNEAAVMLSCALCLMRSFPSLQYMEIQVMAISDDDMLENLEVDRFSDVTFNHLREVKLDNFECVLTDMEFIELLLAKSPVLERVILNHNWRVKESTKDKMRDYISYIKPASPKAEVVFKTAFDKWFYNTMLMLGV